jgi:hypothetical protein
MIVTLNVAISFFKQKFSFKRFRFTFALYTGSAKIRI